MSQRSFGASIGVSGGLVGQVEADLAPPSRSFLQKLSATYGVSADWLLNGVGEMCQAPKLQADADIIMVTPEGETPVEIKTHAGGGFRLIPRMELSVSAGSGVVPADNAYSEALAFSDAWLRKNAVNAQLSVLVSVKGDSMAPAIPDGALVLVHLPEKSVEHEGIYAFNRGEASFIKHLVPSSLDKSGRPGSIAIISSNPAYPPEVLSGKDMNELRIVGRVRCVMTTL